MLLKKNNDKKTLVELVSDYSKVARCKFFFNFTKWFYTFIFRQRGREGESREKNIDGLPLTGSPVRVQPSNRGMCPDKELDQQPFTVQDTQPTGPHWSGHRIQAVIYKSQLLSCITEMNKWNLIQKHSTVYISTPTNEILMYKSNKMCTRSI